MLTHIRSLLSYLPWEIEHQVNLVALAEAIAEAELMAEGGSDRFVVAAKAVLDARQLIFPDPTYRALAVHLLTVVLNTHAA